MDHIAKNKKNHKKQPHEASLLISEPNMNIEDFFEKVWTPNQFQTAREKKLKKSKESIVTIKRQERRLFEVPEPDSQTEDESPKIDIEKSAESLSPNSILKEKRLPYSPMRSSYDRKEQVTKVTFEDQIKR